MVLVVQKSTEFSKTQESYLALTTVLNMWTLNCTFVQRQTNSGFSKPTQTVSLIRRVFLDVRKYLTNAFFEISPN